MSQATLTSKGRVTIPKAVRKRLGLKAGDRLDFIVNDAGEAVMRWVSRSVKETRGMLAHGSRGPVTVEQLDEALRQGFRAPRR